MSSAAAPNPPVPPAPPAPPAPTPKAAPADPSDALDPRALRDQVRAAFPQRIEPGEVGMGYKAGLALGATTRVVLPLI